MADRSGLTNGLAIVIASLSAVVLILSLRTPLERFRRVFRQSVPVLGLAAVLDLIAGFAVRKKT